MPNWVTNKLSIQGTDSQIKEILSAIAGNEQLDNEITIRYIDFNKIIPMPTDLMIEDGSRGSQGLRYIIGLAEPDMKKEVCELWDKKSQEEKDQCLLLAAKYLTNKLRYDAQTWYNWCIRNWGTKWNTCNTSRDGNTIYFDTAWSTPVPIIVALSQKYPEVTFEVDYADEDVGNNVGTYSYKSGKEIHFTDLSGSQDGLGLAISLLGIEEHFEFVDGKYRRKEE